VSFGFSGRVKTLVLPALLAAALPLHAAEFRSADVHEADDYPTVVAVRHMGELLDKRSNGRYRIRVYNKGVLGTEKETIEQAKSGALDMTRVNVGPMNRFCAKTQVPTMPFLFRSVEHMRRVLDGPVGDEILKSCESEGFVGLAFYDSGARSLYANKPIRTVADAKDLKIRVQQSDLWVALVSAIGASPAPMPYAHVYAALKAGLIDAAENNVPSYETARHYEAVKVYSRTEHSMAPEMLLMSKKVWDRLPKPDQDLIRAAAKESVVVERRKWDEQEAKSLAKVKAAGAQIVDVDKKTFQDAMAPVYAKFMTTPDLQRLVKAVQETK
jgi:tripartite ATP-independent transporter DctP family solute receptor